MTTDAAETMVEAFTAACQDQPAAVIRAGAVKIALLLSPQALVALGTGAGVAGNMEALLFLQACSLIRYAEQVERLQEELALMRAELAPVEW